MDLYSVSTVLKRRDIMLRCERCNRIIWMWEDRYPVYYDNLYGRMGYICPACYRLYLIYVRNPGDKDPDRGYRLGNPYA